MHWKTAEQEDFPEGAQVAPFELPASETWSVVEMDLPVKQKTSTVRLYLPVDQGLVEIRSIDYLDSRTQKSIKRWDFATK